MKRSFARLGAVLIFTGLAGYALAQTADNEENRAQAAKRYLEVVPIKEVMTNVANEIAQTLPEEVRQGFLDMMLNELDLELLEKASRDAMVKTFTVAEIDAMTTFYSTPEGRAVMKKLGKYTADLMPVMQQEISRVTMKFQAMNQ